MMIKKVRIILFSSVMVSSILFISLGIKTKAQDCSDCDPIPTSPGDADYSKINCDCIGATPTIVASAITIAPGASITLHVDSGDLACPPFTWEVDDIAYSITSETSNDLEEATLTASSGSCGGTYDDDNINVTVTITDSCEQTDTITIRNTDGDWNTGWSCRFVSSPRGNLCESGAACCSPVGYVMEEGGFQYAFVTPVWWPIEYSPVYSLDSGSCDGAYPPIGPANQPNCHPSDENYQRGRRSCYVYRWICP